MPLPRGDDVKPPNKSIFAAVLKSKQGEGRRGGEGAHSKQFLSGAELNRKESTKMMHAHAYDDACMYCPDPFFFSVHSWFPM